MVGLIHMLGSAQQKNTQLKSPPTIAQPVQIQHVQNRNHSPKIQVNYCIAN